MQQCVHPFKVGTLGHDMHEVNKRDGVLENRKGKAINLKPCSLERKRVKQCDPEIQHKVVHEQNVTENIGISRQHLWVEDVK